MILRSITLLTVLSLLSLTVVDSHAEAPELKTNKQKISYLLGQQLGSSIRDQGVEIDYDVFTMSVKDALDGKESKLSQEEMRTVMMSLQKEMQARQAQQGVENKAAAKKFLEGNKTKKGVIETASGLQYMVLKEGNGANPKPTDRVKVHYRGTLLNGSEFDSSYKRNQPAEFPLNRVIKGWTEGIPLMKVGGKTKFFIPPELAYGEAARPGLPSNSLLVFEVELLEIK